MNHRTSVMEASVFAGYVTYLARTKVHERISPGYHAVQFVITSVFA